MNDLSDNFLTLADRSTRRFGFINSAMAAITNKIIPQATAAACSSGVTCYYYCGGGCPIGSGGIAKYRVYSINAEYCGAGVTYECLHSCPSRCDE